jgi:hypothetical protein
MMPIHLEMSTNIYLTHANFHEISNRIFAFSPGSPSACRKGHLIAPPATLRPELPGGIDLFVTEPPISLFVLDELDGT